jgi:hypothetical protein
MQKKLIDKFLQNPSESDGPGFIYAFMSETENGLLETPYWLKIGRTKEDQPQKRIYQWERE